VPINPSFGQRAAERERIANLAAATQRSRTRPPAPTRYQDEGEGAYRNRCWRWEMWYRQEPRPDLSYASPDEEANYRQWRSTTIADALDSLVQAGPGGICDACGHFASRHTGVTCLFPRQPPATPCSCPGMAWSGLRFEMHPISGPVRAVGLAS